MEELLKTAFGWISDFFISKISKISKAKNIFTTENIFSSAIISVAITAGAIYYLSNKIDKAKDTINVINRKIDKVEDIINVISRKSDKVEDTINVTNRKGIVHYIVIPESSIKKPQMIHETINSNNGIYYLGYVENARMDSSGQGMRLKKHHKIWAKAFYLAAIECSKNDEKVKLRVKGHASSAKFYINGKPALNSDVSNVLAANKRAEKLLEYFKTIDAGDSVEIDFTRYKTIDDVIKNRPYIDNFDGLGSPNSRAQEFLNRSISIEILDAGSCKKPI